MKKKVLTRLQNPKVIVSVVSGVCMILVNTGTIDIAMSEKALEITNIALGIGISIGVLGNPESHVKNDE